MTHILVTAIKSVGRYGSSLPSEGTVSVIDAVRYLPTLCVHGH